jgi:hypothetical protein
MRAAWFLAAVCLGCSANVGEEGCEMREILDGKLNIAEHWGGLREIPNSFSWAENARVAVISKPPYRAMFEGHPVYCVPQVQSALLAVRFIPNPDDSSANYTLRWVITIGAGGTRSEVKIDALNTQQVSLAGENLRVDLLCEKGDPLRAWDSPFPKFGVNASATFADGNVSSSSATYTQNFQVAAGGSWLVPIPPMATGWRVLGNQGSATGPFTAGVLYIVQGFGGLQISGDLLSNKDPFYPVGGVQAVKGFRISNPTAGLIQGSIQWGLDL